MSSESRSFAEQQAPATISRQECRAIRALDADGYSRRELAMMFECVVETITRHADHACSHGTRAPGFEGDEQAAEAFLDGVRFWEEDDDGE